MNKNSGAYSITPAITYSPIYFNRYLLWNLLHTPASLRIIQLQCHSNTPQSIYHLITLRSISDSSIHKGIYTKTALLPKDQREMLAWASECLVLQTFELFAEELITAQKEITTASEEWWHNLYDFYWNGKRETFLTPQKYTKEYMTLPRSYLPSTLTPSVLTLNNCKCGQTNHNFPFLGVSIKMCIMILAALCHVRNE